MSLDFIYSRRLATRCINMCPRYWFQYSQRGGLLNLVKGYTGIAIASCLLRMRGHY